MHRLSNKPINTVFNHQHRKKHSRVDHRRLKKKISINEFQSTMIPAVAYWNLLGSLQEPGRTTGRYAITQPYRNNCVSGSNRCMNNDFINDLKQNENIDYEDVNYLDTYHKKMYDMVQNDHNLFIRNYNPNMNYKNSVQLQENSQWNAGIYCIYKHAIVFTQKGRNACRCKQMQEKDCQVLGAGSMYYYIGSEKLTGGGLLDGSKLDSWNYGVKSCNDQNCNLYGRLQLEAAQYVIHHTIQIEEISQLLKYVWKIIMSNIASENVRDVGIAMTYETASMSCIDQFDNAMCRNAIHGILKTYEKQADSQVLEQSLSRAPIMLKSLKSSLKRLIEYYYGFASYNSEGLESVKGIKTYEYYCPFIQSEFVEDRQVCICKQKRVGLCQMIQAWVAKDEGDVVLEYQMAGVDVNEQQTTKQGDDNWLTGIQSCNSVNCDEYAKLVIEGVDRYVGKRNGQQVDDGKDIKKPEKEQKNDDDASCVDDEMNRKLKRVEYGQIDVNMSRRMKRTRKRKNHRKV